MLSIIRKGCKPIKPDGLIFDFDGLILDTETPEYEACQEVFAEYGTELPLALWSKAIGTRGGFDPHAHLERVTGRSVDRAHMDARRRSLYEARMRGCGVRPGVKEYLRDASAQGIPIGLASSSGRRWVEGYLRQFGLWEYFSCVRTADDVRQVKPDPELYRSALAGLGARAGQTVAFEDSPNGALAAVRAGMLCVIIPNPVTALLEFPDGVAWRLNSMADMPLPELLLQLPDSFRAPLC